MIASEQTRGPSGTRSSRSSDGGVVSGWFYLYVYAGLLVVSGALQRPIGGESVEGAWTTGVVHNTNYAILIVGAVFYGITILVALWHARTIRLANASAPVLALVLVALLSALWSDSPAVVLNRGLGLVGCTLFALTTISRLGIQRTMTALTLFFAVFFVVNLLLSFALYDYTHHSADEILYHTQAGRLKGTYPHKNALGAILSFGIIPVALFGMDVLRSRIVFVLVLLAGLYLLLAAQAAQTFVSVPLGFALGYLLTVIRYPFVRVVTIVSVLVIGGVVSSLGAIQEVQDLVLTTVGRDATMSGRTTIWSAAIDEAVRRPVLGGGYQTGWEAGVGDAVQSALGSDPGHAHNGFIELFVDLGALGETIFLLFLGILLFRIISANAVRNTRMYMFLCTWFVVFVLNNLAGSYILVPSDMSWFFVMFASYIAGMWARGRASGAAVRPIRPLFVPDAR